MNSIYKASTNQNNTLSQCQAHYAAINYTSKFCCYQFISYSCTFPFLPWPEPCLHFMTNQNKNVCTSCLDLAGGAKLNTSSNIQDVTLSQLHSTVGVISIRTPQHRNQFKITSKKWGEEIDRCLIIYQLNYSLNLRSLKTSIPYNYQTLACKQP